MVSGQWLVACRDSEIAPTGFARLDFYEINLDPMRNHPGFVSATKQFANAGSTRLAVIKRVLVHVHPDESVGEIGFPCHARKSWRILTPFRGDRANTVCSF